VDEKIVQLCFRHLPRDPRVFLKEGLSLIKEWPNIVALCRTDKQLDESLGYKVKGYGLSRGFDCAMRLYKAGLAEKGDVYHAHEPESLVIGYLLKRKLGCRLIYDSHEFQSSRQMERVPKLFRKLAITIYQMIEGWLAKKCDYMIGATWYVQDYLKRVGDTEYVDNIINTPPIEDFKKFPDIKRESKPTLVHEGYFGFNRGLSEIMDAVEILTEKYDMKFLIAGKLHYAEVEKYMEKRLENPKLEKAVERLGMIPYLELGRAHLRAHVGLICLKGSQNEWENLPNKLFNYMYFGLPFVGPDCNAGIKKIVEEEKCGLLVDIYDPKAIAQAVSEFFENPGMREEMGERARYAVENKYNWQEMENQLIFSYKTMLKRPVR
jgi:hypothetical protein